MTGRAWQRRRVMAKVDKIRVDNNGVGHVDGDGDGWGTWYRWLGRGDYVVG